MMSVRQVVPDLGLDLRKMPDLSDAKTRARLSPPAITAFLRIVEHWGLKNEQAMALLGGMSNGKYHSLKRQRTVILGQDELTRISYLIGIFKSLNILFSAKLANQWVQLENTNPMFKGAAPIQVMVRIGMPALMETRRLLDSRRGGR
ncbi:MAG TPA: antitoxin Xre-like helix-turn-helix domain-containing protein [Candidatus Koribacter sp.]|jgi:hypothetical protein